MLSQTGIKAVGGFRHITMCVSPKDLGSGVAGVVDCLFGGLTGGLYR